MVLKSAPGESLKTCRSIGNDKRACEQATVNPFWVPLEIAVPDSPGGTLLAHCVFGRACIQELIEEYRADRPSVTGSLISSVLIMFSTTCRIIVFACVLERAADLPMRSSARTIHLFDSGRLGQSQGLDADTAWQL